MSEPKQVVQGFEVFDSCLDEDDKPSQQNPQQQQQSYQQQQQSLSDSDRETPTPHEISATADSDTEILHKDIPQIYTISFSQSGNTVAIGTVKGFRVQETDGNKQKYVLEETSNPLGSSGIKLISLLYDTYICAVVTDNKNKLFPSSKVYIIDAIQGVLIQEYDFFQPITNLQYIREFLLVSSESRILLYDIVNKKPLKYILDVAKPVVFTTSRAYDTFTYAYITDDKNNVIAWNVWLMNPILIDIRQEILNNQISLPTDNSSQQEIVRITLSPDGQLCAIATKGAHSVKIFDTASGKLKATLYRGKTAKIITDMKFTNSNNILGLISTAENIHIDEATLHIYDISGLKGVVNSKNGTNNSNSNDILLANVISQQFYFSIMKKQSYCHKETQLSGPLLLFSKDERSFTIYSDSDYTISVNLELSNAKPKEYIPDNKKLDGWIDPVREN